jgi:hypothetical protein
LKCTVQGSQVCSQPSPDPSPRSISISRTWTFPFLFLLYLGIKLRPCTRRQGTPPLSYIPSPPELFIIFSNRIPFPLSNNSSFLLCPQHFLSLYLTALGATVSAILQYWPFVTIFHFTWNSSSILWVYIRISFFLRLNNILPHFTDFIFCLTPRLFLLFGYYE